MRIVKYANGVYRCKQQVLTIKKLAEIIRENDELRVFDIDGNDISLPSLVEVALWEIMPMQRDTREKLINVLTLLISPDILYEIVYAGGIASYTLRNLNRRTKNAPTT